MERGVTDTFMNAIVVILETQACRQMIDANKEWRTMSQHRSDVSWRDEPFKK